MKRTHSSWMVALVLVAGCSQRSSSGEDRAETGAVSADSAHAQDAMGDAPTDVGTVEDTAVDVTQTADVQDVQTLPTGCVEPPVEVSWILPVGTRGGPACLTTGGGVCAQQYCRREGNTCGPVVQGTSSTPHTGDIRCNEGMVTPSYCTVIVNCADGGITPTGFTW